MMRHLCGVFTMGAALAFGQPVLAVPINVINPGGEVYPTGPNTAINPGGVAPIATTGWNATVAGIPGTSGAEGINNNAFSGVIRLAVGATDASTVAASDFVLFQETDHVASAGDIYALNFLGRAFFQFNAGTDFQTSLFGYVDSGGSLVQVDAMTHASTVAGIWTPALPHVFTVPAGSPLVGENLVIGFLTGTPGVGTGGFTAVDDVRLDLVPEPATWVMGLAGLAGAGAFRRRRSPKS